MRTNVFETRGAAALPWILALTGYALAAVVWIAPGSPGRDAGTGVGGEAGESDTLRVALDVARRENAALRTELDRLVEMIEPDDGAAKLPSFVPKPKVEGEGLTQSDRASLADDLERAAALAGAGDEAAKKEMAKTIMALLQDGRAAFPTFLDAYHDIQDPQGRKLLLPAMLFTGGIEARNFLVEQAEAETDPALRATLLGQAAKYSNQKIAQRLEPRMIETLEESEDPYTRKLLVQGLGRSGTPTATQALAYAATDPNPEIRLLAIDQLAANPGGWSEIETVLSSNVPDDIHDFAECRLLVARTLRQVRK